MPFHGKVSMDDSAATSEGNRTTFRKASSFRSFILYASLLHASLVLIVLALFMLVGESWWPVSLLLFCPRWLFLTPLLVLGLATARAKCHSLWLLHAAVAMVVIGPIMRPNVPLGATRRTANEGIPIRVLTLNQHNGRFRAEALIDLIESEGVNLVCFQEIQFLPALEAYFSRGWFRDRSRCVASRFPIVEELDPSVPLFDDPGCVRVRIRPAPGTDFIFASVHGPTIRQAFHSLLERDTRGFASAVESRRSFVRELLATLDNVRGLPTIIAGDFNVPAGSSLLAPLRLDFRDGFEQAGWGFGYTWPSWLPGIRIDQIHASHGWTFSRCWVGPDLGSDHRPLIAELAFSEPGRGRTNEPKADP